MPEKITPSRKLLVAIALLQNVFAAGVASLLVVVIEPRSNSGGFAGLAMTLAIFTILSYAAQIVSVLLAWLLLKRAGFQRPFVITVTAFVLSLLGGAVMGIVLPDQSGAVVFALGLVASISFYVLAHELVKRLRGRSFWYFAIPIGLSAAIAAALYVQYPLAENYLKKTNNDKVARLDFAVFKPAYLPNGISQGPLVINEYSLGEKLLIEYPLVTGNTQFDRINVYQTRHSELTDKLIVPPDVCHISLAAVGGGSSNTQVPVEKSDVCIEKTTPGGIAYLRQDKSTTARRVDAHWFYIRKGDTAIFIEFNYAYFRYSDSFEPELGKIIDSFQTQSAESLQK